MPSIWGLYQALSADDRSLASCPSRSLITYLRRNDTSEAACTVLLSVAYGVRNTIGQNYVSCNVSFLAHLTCQSIEGTSFIRWSEGFPFFVNSSSFTSFHHKKAGYLGKSVSLLLSSCQAVRAIPDNGSCHGYWCRGCRYAAHWHCRYSPARRRSNSSEL
jgi:hypothetical protein